jgi:hypothetical protein
MPGSRDMSKRKINLQGWFIACMLIDTTRNVGQEDGRPQCQCEESILTPVGMVMALKLLSKLSI